MNLEKKANNYSIIQPEIYDFEWFQKEEIRLGHENHVDITKYAEEGFDWTQLKEIRLGLMDGIEVSPYAKKQYISYQMQQIRKGIVAGVNTNFYCNPEYDWFQMEEIRLGLEAKIDVTIYANKSYEYFCMRQIRKGLLVGINLVPYREKGYSNRILREIRRAKANQINILPNVEEGYDYEQLEQIRIAKQNNQDLMPHVNKSTSGSQMKQIRLGLEHGLDVTNYKASAYNWAQMKEIRLGLEHKIDVKWYCNKLYTKNQMREIRLGLEAKLNVASYTRLMLSATDMRISREWILQNGDLEKPSEVDKTKETNETKKTDAANQYKANETLIIIQEDNMKVYLELAEEDEKTTLEELLKRLSVLGIKMGINKDLLKDIIDKKRYHEKLVIAEGKQSTNGIDGSYDYFFKTERPSVPKLLSDGSVDYKNIDFFEQVTAGQKLAVYQRATGGEFGYTVLGALITPQKGKDLLPLKGKGFTRLEDEITYVSNMDGRIEKDDSQILISPIYTHKGDITNAVGNLRFNGDIEINGSVGSGVYIEAAGDVVISGNVESATIKAGKQIMVKGGVNSSGEAYLEAGDLITGKFFENVKLVSENGVKANYLLNCEVSTMGRVTVSGKRGNIVGGVIHAVQGVDAYSIGNIAEIRTVLDIGANDVFNARYTLLEQEISKAQSEIEIFEQGLVKFEKSYKKEELAQLNIYIKTSQAILEKQEEVKVLKKNQTNMVKSISSSESLQLKVTGIVYPGCLIRMNQNNLLVREKAEMVIFRIEEGRVAAFAGHK